MLCHVGASFVLGVLIELICVIFLDLNHVIIIGQYLMGRRRQPYRKLAK